jgi:hypothetical protein
MYRELHFFKISTNVALQHLMILYMYKPSCGNFRHFQRASQYQAVPALFLLVEQHHRSIQRCRLHLWIVLQPELSVARAFADATVSRCQKAVSKSNSEHTHTAVCRHVIAKKSYLFSLATNGMI